MAPAPATTCEEHYPDVYTLPDDAPDPGGINEQNDRRKLLYAALRKVLRDNFSFDSDGNTAKDAEDFADGFGTDQKAHFLAVFGTLLSRNLEDPTMGRGEWGTQEPGDDTVELDGVNFATYGAKKDGKWPKNLLITRRFIEAVTDAEKRFNANHKLFRAVFTVLLDLGADNPDNPSNVTVSARELAEVTGRLIDDRISADHPQIRLLVTNALSQVLGSQVDGEVSGIDIKLPNLDEGTAIEILAANVKAIAMIYFSAMLEELKLYAVADKVAEHFMIGMLPISRGPAGNKIYAWIREVPDRFSEIERRSIYGRALGLAQGAATDVLPNREFSDLWIRFLSSVSMYNRDKNTTNTRVIDRTQVIKAARDLSVNLSLHGYGVAHFAAVQMQQLIGQIKEMLSQPELLQAYGVNDDRQLIERVSAMYLGGSMNGVRYRTMAQAGGQIILWLAEHAPIISSDSPSQTVKVDVERADLLNNVESWRAVTGMQDSSLEQYSESVDLATQPVIPPFAPTNGTSRAIRNVMEQVGLPNLQPVV